MEGEGVDGHYLLCPKIYPNFNLPCFGSTRLLVFNLSIYNMIFHTFSYFLFQQTCYSVEKNQSYQYRHQYQPILKKVILVFYQYQLIRIFHLFAFIGIS